MQGNVIRKIVPERCQVLIGDAQDLGKCEDAAPDAIKKCEGGIPNVRFRGFKDDWEQRKCGDVLNERNIQHPQSEEFPLVSFTVENGVTSKTERYEREQLVRGSKEAKKYKETRLDDIVYNPANLKFGAIARNKLGNAVFSPIYVTYEVDKSLALPSFVEMFVTRNNFIQNALQYQQGTVYERMSVSTADFATLDITLPSIAEQKQIGQYFQQLDHLITLHQRKCDETKELKKYMLQKMFPRDGEKVPEIRFQGFTGEWEQRRLGELIVKGGSGGTPLSSNSSYYDGTIPFLSITDITKSNGFIYDTEKHISEEGLNSSSAWIVPKEAISLAMYASVGKVAILKENIATSQAFYNMIFEDDCIRNFVYQYLRKMEENDAWIPYISTGTQANLNAEKVKNLMLLLPKTNNEMKKISDCLFYIDHLIDLRQRKCDELKELKQYMLRNMFPQKR
ncbi:MAG: restriction endonuclease subunit S [Blautia sp.]|uniref:restriction endonuclease subunit S n=1 Tax=Blautia sp. TaxID=1955243 RepID=UPI0025BF361A|nr:restriction endonuclease subunit S [Blautia sp.]MCI7451142.1 restriction endonuclease subunit S [Blautia sp.]